MLHILRSNIALRWFMAWIVVSVLLSACASLVPAYFSLHTYLGQSFIEIYFFISPYSLLWFVWGEIFSHFWLLQGSFTAARRILSLLVLVVLLISLLIATAFIALEFAWKATLS